MNHEFARETSAKRNAFLTEEEFSSEFISALPCSFKSTEEELCLFKADLVLLCTKLLGRFGPIYAYHSHVGV